MPGSIVTMGLSLLLTLLFGSGRALAQRDPAASLNERVAAELSARTTELIAFRRDLHLHPEPSGEEARTAERVATRLRRLGLAVRTGVGGHGVVALLRGSRPGPVVAFRADMDAVPTSDPDPVDFASLIPGVRHICGHDIHTTIGLALAQGLVAVQEDLRGGVLFIFQPAEERATGARAMLADGVFALARPVAIYAVHTAPLEVGRLATARGALFASRDRVQVTLEGTGDLAATADSVRQILLGLGTITASEARGSLPEDFVLVEVDAAGTTAARGRVLSASLSMANSLARTRTRASIDSALLRLRASGVATTLSYRERVTAGVTNDSALVDRANASIRSALAEATVVPVGVVSPRFSEDFGSFQVEVPGVMYLLGVSNRERGWEGMPHSPGYVADERAIVFGARALAAVILDRLNQGD